MKKNRTKKNLIVAISIFFGILLFSGLAYILTNNMGINNAQASTSKYIAIGKSVIITSKKVVSTGVSAQVKVVQKGTNDVTVSVTPKTAKTSCSISGSSIKCWNNSNKLKLTLLASFYKNIVKGKITGITVIVN